MYSQEITNIIILTLSFVSILISIGIIIFVNAIVARKNAIIESQSRADKELLQKLNLLELSALRSQLNPHFIHNSLNSIQHFIQQKEVEVSENYLTKFSKLIRLFFEYSRRQTVTVKEEIALIENYLQIEQLRFEDKLHFTLMVDENIEEEEQVLPSMLLQPLVENAINHGLFHKEGKGHVSILFNYLNKSTIKIIIEDDGIGIIKSKELYVKSSKNYQSRSSAVLQERIELLNQTGNWKIEYEILDLSEIKNSSGTQVSLIINQKNHED